MLRYPRSRPATCLVDGNQPLKGLKLGYLANLWSWPDDIRLLFGFTVIEIRIKCCLKEHDFQTSSNARGAFARLPSFR